MNMNSEKNKWWNNILHNKKIYDITSFKIEIENKFESLDNLVKFILDNNIDLNLKSTKGGFTILMVCANFCENEQLVESLLSYHSKDENEKENNIDINIQDMSGYTALMHAISNYNNIKLFLSHSSININLQSNSGWTALMLAAASSNIKFSNKVVELLLSYRSPKMENNINVNLQDKGGNTALMLAVKYIGYSTKKSIDLLLSYSPETGENTDINLKNNIGWTALMYAIYIRDEQIINLLINKGAEFDIKYIKSLKIDSNELNLFYDYYINKLETRIQQLQILKPIHTQDDVMRSIVLTYL